jgi:nitroreductase
VIDDSIRGRRTIKEFTAEPVPRPLIEALLDLAVYAPNHHRTEPWRFVVIGPATIEALVEATGDGKLRRSTTAIVVAQAVAPDPAVAREDYAACAAAIQTLLLAARARDLASYWRTPKALDLPAAHEILGLEQPAVVVGIVHLGAPAIPFPTPPRRSAGTVTRWLSYHST